MMTKIFWFTSYSKESPSTRYRVTYPMNYLSEDQFKHYLYIPSAKWQRKVTLVLLLLKAYWYRNNSVVVIQKVCTNGWYPRLLNLLISSRSVKSIYDIDDAEHLRNDNKHLNQLLTNCSSVTVGSVKLKEIYSQFNPNIRVLTSPVIDHHEYKKVRNEKLKVGWVGDTGNSQGITKDFSHKTSLFQMFFPELKKIPFEMELTLIGVNNEVTKQEILEYFKDTPHIELNIPMSMDWRNDQWLYQIISTFDIGVSPLVHHMYNECKSAFKVKQYLSAGIPVIASDVGENKNFISHGENGFLVNQDSDFIHYINQIKTLSNHDYSRMVENAIQSKKLFSMENYCRKLIGEIKLLEFESNNLSVEVSGSY